MTTTTKTITGKSNIVPRTPMQKEYSVLTSVPDKGIVEFDRIDEANLHSSIEQKSIV